MGRKTGKVIEYKHQTFFIDSGTYPFDILIFVNETNEAVSKTMLQYFDQKDIDSCKVLMTTHAKTFQIYGKFGVRFNNLNVNSPASFGVVAHEMFHVTEFMFELMGLNYSSKASEAYAYQIEYFVKKFFEKITH